MPKTTPTREALPADELLLAAIDRAERHSRHEEPGVLLATIKDHLGIVHNSWTTRLLRPRLEALDGATGVVEQSRRHGLNLWGLTERGRELLKGLRSAGKPWGTFQRRRNIGTGARPRASAGERIDDFRAGLRDVMTETTQLLDSDNAVGSDAWYELGHRLLKECSRLGSATHCLYEWAEPDDAQADIDEPAYGRGDRRNIRQWDSEYA